MFVGATQIVKMCPQLLSILQAETFQKASELQGQQLVIGRTNRENAPRPFSVKLAGR